MKLSPQGIISICSSEKLCWSQVKIADNVEQFPQRWETDPIGDAADVRAALAQVQAHAVLRYILLCPQVCDSAAQKASYRRDSSIRPLLSSVIILILADD